MRRFAMLILLAFPLGWPAHAQGPVVATEVESPSRVYRISALIRGARGYLVGFVDSANEQSFFIPEQETARGITVLEVDYASERIRLNIGGETRELYLTDAPESRTVKVLPSAAEEPYLDDLEPSPDDPADPRPGAPLEPSEGLKAMMAQFPNAVPTNFLTQPNAIQQMMEQHPELAEKLNQPVGRYGAGIEGMMKLYPALSNRVHQANGP